ncbi:hypothetical protein MLD38_031501 [Melastoma candidum]|nr:hypothetical protein MLD38_031501 [Melastoma candidum]
MDGFCRVLAGSGWTFYRTRKEGRLSDCTPDWGRGGSEVYLFRKVDLNRVWVRTGGNSGDNCRVRELRLPSLDFGNAPLRILQYVLLMTDDVFYLA